MNRVLTIAGVVAMGLLFVGASVAATWWIEAPPHRVAANYKPNVPANGSAFVVRIPYLVARDRGDMEYLTPYYAQNETETLDALIEEGRLVSLQEGDRIVLLELSPEDEGVHFSVNHARLETPYGETWAQGSHVLSAIRSEPERH